MVKTRLIPDDLQDLKEIVDVIENTYYQEYLMEFTEDIILGSQETLDEMLELDDDSIAPEEFTANMRATALINFFRLCVYHKELVQTCLELEDKYGGIAHAMHPPD